MEISHEGTIEGSLGVVNRNEKSRINRNLTVKRGLVSVLCPYYIIKCVLLYKKRWYRGDIPFVLIYKDEGFFTL